MCRSRVHGLCLRDAQGRPQVEAFDDTWHWTPQTQAEYERLITGHDVPAEVSKTIDAFRVMLAVSSPGR